MKINSRGERKRNLENYTTRMFQGGRDWRLCHLQLDFWFIVGKASVNAFGRKKLLKVDLAINATVCDNFGSSQIKNRKLVPRWTKRLRDWMRHISNAWLQSSANILKTKNIWKYMLRSRNFQCKEERFNEPPLVFVENFKTKLNYYSKRLKKILIVQSWKFSGVPWNCGILSEFFNWKTFTLITYVNFQNVRVKKKDTFESEIKPHFKVQLFKLSLLCFAEISS